MRGSNVAERRLENLVQLGPSVLSNFQLAIDHCILKQVSPCRWSVRSLCPLNLIVACFLQVYCSSHVACHEMFVQFIFSEWTVPCFDLCPIQEGYQWGMVPIPQHLGSSCLGHASGHVRLAEWHGFSEGRAHEWCAWPLSYTQAVSRKQTASSHFGRRMELQGWPSLPIEVLAQLLSPATLPCWTSF